MVKKIGTEHINPLIGTRSYEVEFIYIATETITANIISITLLSQVDEEGHRQLLLDDIINYRKNGNAVHKYDAFVDNFTRIKQKNMIMKGWDICVRWKYGSTDWIVLRDIKQSYPIELAGFSLMHGIHEDRDFAWWVTYVEKKRKTIIS